MSIKEGLLNFIFPIECLGCGKEDVWLCEACKLKIPINEIAYCLFCRQINLIGKTCQGCAVNHFLDGIFIISDYDDKKISLLIKSLKYNFIKNLGEILGDLAVVFLKKIMANISPNDFNFKNCLIIPLPLHKKRYNWRGFNQAEIIAVQIAIKLNLKLSDGLIKIKANKPQAKLNEKERLQNNKNCFTWTLENLSGKNILLVDDVATTGATLDEAARILKNNGAKKVWGLVIAKG